MSKEKLYQACTSCHNELTLSEYQQIEREEMARLAQLLEINTTNDAEEK